MELLDINDTGVGDEIARIQLNRHEAEILFMFVDMGCDETADRIAALADNPTTMMASLSLASEWRWYAEIRDLLDMMLKRWEDNDSDEPLAGVI